MKSIEETFEGHDIDAILEDKDIKAHTDDGSELTASDADIRGKLYEITGEEGVMPGDEVQVGMGIQDRSLAGNVLPDDAMDFSFDEDADELNPAAAAAENKRRRGVRRRQKTETAECGACGADIPVDASECQFVVLNSNEGFYGEEQSQDYDNCRQPSIVLGNIGYP